MRDSAGTDASTLNATARDGRTDAPFDAPLTDAAHAGTDAQESDMSDGGASDGPNEGGTARVVAGTNLEVGPAGGGYFVLYYAPVHTYYAQPFAGGPMTTIYAAPLSDSADNFSAVGNVEFVWSWTGEEIGALVAWSPGMAQGALLTSSGLAYSYQSMWASDDSEHVAYLQNASSDATVGALYGASIDGTDTTLLLSDVDINVADASCFPRMVFQGDAAVVSYCAVADGGGLTPEMEAFSISNGWASVAMVPNWVDSFQFNPLDRSPFTFPFALDPSGGQIAAASASSGNGAVQVFPLDGGPGVVVDPSVQLTPSLSFTGSVKDPWSILYNNGAGALMQAYAANPTPQVLVGAGVNYFNALSYDGHWMLVSNATNSAGWFADLSLVSTTSPGAPVLLASSSDSGGLPVSPSSSQNGGSRGFTTDSAYALVETNMTKTSSGVWLSSLRSVSVAPPYTTTLLTNGATLGYTPVLGSKIIVADNYQQPDGGLASVDIDEVDPASGDGGTVNIVTGVAVGYAVSSDLTQIAYVVTAGPAPGIYVSSLP
jgi:hypothetical protein